MQKREMTDFITKDTKTKSCEKECKNIEEIKKCKICNKEKSTNLFYKSKLYKDGYSYCCKICDKSLHKKSYNKEKIVERTRLWRKNNVDEWKKIQENYKEKRRILLKNRYNNDEDYRNRCLKSYHKYLNDPKNKDSIKNTQKNNKIKYKTNPQYRIIDNLRCRLRGSLKLTGNKKYDKTMSLLGCDRLFLIKYLESKFKTGMDWNNHSFKGWHIDHIIPCSRFDLSNEDDQKKCFHYTNLQPLWWYENLVKGGRYIG